ncbi:MAG: sulfite exporter TauE/SafE family protein [Pirellulales bacterium]
MEWPFLFVAGILGSAHCVGMCGGFVMSIGAAAQNARDNFLRQVVYSAGRLFTYSVLGATAGFAGWRLTKAVPSTIHISALLAIAAGALLIWQGLSATGLFRRRTIAGGQTPCLAGTMFSGFLRMPGRTAAFLAGVLTGLLPCGLLYGMIALAASTHDLVAGLTTMLVFGLGTAPILIATGCGGSLLGLAARRKLYVVAAWCMVLTGGISLARGAVFLAQKPSADKPPACPLCAERESGR